jgi:hypothetical protein
MYSVYSRHVSIKQKLMMLRPSVVGKLFQVIVPHSGFRMIQRYGLTRFTHGLLRTRGIKRCVTGRLL